MGAPPTGISEADWSATPVGVRAGFLELLQHGQEQQQEIEQLRAQLTALATELASLRERIGRSSRNSSKPPSSDGPGFSLQSGVKAVAASAVASRVIQDPDRSCCRSSGLMRSSSITLRRAVAAAPCSREMIQSHCGIR
jgi:cell division septum initiation protein DivIVA